jgi:hypothetical protein
MVARLGLLDVPPTLASSADVYIDVPRLQAVCVLESRSLLPVAEMNGI